MRVSRRWSTMRAVLASASSIVSHQKSTSTVAGAQPLYSTPTTGTALVSRTARTRSSTTGSYALAPDVDCAHMSRLDGAPVGLLGIAAYVPDRVMENAEWSQYVDTTDEWIRERTGIERRRIAAPAQTTLDLAEQAARRALAGAVTAVDDVDEIIVATDTPES